MTDMEKIILKRVKKEPTVTSRAIERETGICRNTVNKILKLNGYVKEWICKN